MYLEIFKNIFKFLIRKVLHINDISLYPASRVFGYDRGLPIDRFYINEFLTKQAKLFKGSCVEIGYPEFALKFNIPPENITVIGVNGGGRDFRYINCDLTSECTLPESVFDLFICTQTLNFISDYKSAVKNSSKLISKEGAFVGTVSGLSTLSKYDEDRWGDYYRFSERAIREALLEYFYDVEIVTYGNLYSAIH